MSETRTRHFVTLFFPGTFVPEQLTREVDGPDAPIGDVTGAFGYQRSKRDEVTINGKVLRGESENVGPRVLFGTVYSVEHVADLHATGTAGDLSILLSNMRGNGWSHVVRTVRGNWQPLEGNVCVERAS